VTHPFIYLLWHSFLNRTRMRLLRLKQPKYLFGALFVLVYLSAYIFQVVFAARRASLNTASGMHGIIGGAGAVILLVLVLSAWIFPHRRAALIFSEAEIAFLFPAPIGRRALVHYKLLKSQFAILFTVLLLTLLTGRLFTASDAWMRVCGWWIILSTLNLHFLGASFARTMLLDRGISNWSRRAIVAATLCIVVASAVLLAGRTPLPSPVTDPADWKLWRDYLSTLFSTAPLSYVLAPFQFILGPYLATSPAVFWKAFGWALLILVAHYLWVLRSNVAFEEASMDASRRMAEKIATARQGHAGAAPRKQARPPFRLAPCGFPVVAIFWKNLISVRAMFRARTIAALAIPVIVVALVSRGSSARGGTMLTTVFLVTLMLFVWSVLIGAQFVRCDFRQDLRSVDLLKIYPLPGWQIAIGELLAPLIILTGVQYVLLTLLAVLTWAGASPSGDIPLAWFVAAGVMVPFCNALLLLIPNAAVLLFPGWFQTRPDAPHGIEVAGQRLLLVFGQMIALGISMVPAAIGFALGFAALSAINGGWLAPIAGAAIASVILLGEAACGVWGLGKLFDRFDPGTEME
jgi:ABC-2 type transport system permease protein